MPDHQHRYNAWEMGEWWCFTCRDDDCDATLECPHCGQGIFEFGFNKEAEKVEWGCWSYGGCGKDVTEFIDSHHWYMDSWHTGKITAEHIPGRKDNDGV